MVVSFSAVKAVRVILSNTAVKINYDSNIIMFVNTVYKTLMHLILLVFIDELNVDPLSI